MDIEQKPLASDLYHPQQPIGWDGKGVIRFRENTIVRALLDFSSKHGFDLNQIAIAVGNGNFPKADMVQLAQLIGYSVSGFGDLSYVPRDMVRRCDTKAAKLVKTKQ